MNVRLIIFSGIMASLVGAMIGLAVSTIAQREQRKPIIIIGGACLGFAIGAVQESIRQQKDERYEEDNGE